MSLTNIYVSMSEIVKKLRLDMPVQVTIHDPITGAEVRLERENILALLVVDTPNLLLDSQWLAALYMEMSRARRACERAAAHAEREFVKWKAQTAAHARKQSETKLTGAQAEEAYRTHPEYEAKAGVSIYYRGLADLFEDAQQAFMLKARMIEVNSRILAGDIRTRHAEDSAETTASLSERASRVLDPGTAVPPRTPRGL